MSFRGIAVSTLCILALSGVSACVERVDSELPPSTKAGVAVGEWELVGTIGEPAELVVDSADPWERRFQDGGFVTLSGIDAVDDELWACDMGISRVQVFDFDGRFKRSYGSGIPVKGTMLSDAELYQDYREKDKTKGKRFWDTTPAGGRWLGTESDNFIAADIAVDKTGYWLADWTKSRPDNRGPRKARILRFSPEGRKLKYEADDVGWPTYVTGSGMIVAHSEPHANAVVLNNFKTDGTATTKQSIGGLLRHLEVTELLATGTKEMRYPEVYARLTQISAEPGKFYNPGGLDIAFDKLLVCDMGNARIQIFDARTDDQFYFGKLLKMVQAEAPDGSKRFARPRDLSVDPGGRVFVLDEDRNEVGILSPTFERIGTLSGDFGSPYAVDLSNDGRHCFVSDRTGAEIFHYARVD
jgi:hypothetical protein